MAGQRLTDKTALDQQAGSGDLLMVVDVNDTTGSAEGTSKKMDFKYVIQTDKISVTSAEFQAMDMTGSAGTFRILVAAPGIGYAIVPLNVFMNVTYVSGVAANKDLYLGFVSTTTQQYWSRATRFMGASANTSYSLQSESVDKGTFNGLVDNKAFVMYANANFVQAFTADVYVTYNIIQL